MKTLFEWWLLRRELVSEIPTQIDGPFVLFRVQCPGKVRIRIHFQLVRTYGHTEHFFPGITSKAKRGCL